MIWRLWASLCLGASTTCTMWSRRSIYIYLMPNFMNAWGRYGRGCESRACGSDISGAVTASVCGMFCMCLGQWIRIKDTSVMLLLDGSFGSRLKKITNPTSPLYKKACVAVYVSKDGKITSCQIAGKLRWTRSAAPPVAMSDKLLHGGCLLMQTTCPCGRSQPRTWSR